MQRHDRAHGHDIARAIHTATREVLRREHGSLYPAPHRLQHKGLIGRPGRLVLDGVEAAAHRRRRGGALRE
jgi:hypothetical protein